MKTKILIRAVIFTLVTTLTSFPVLAQDEGYPEDLPQDDDGIPEDEEYPDDYPEEDGDNVEEWIDDDFEDPSAGSDSAEELNIDYFYDKLSVYGRWFRTQKYGLVWQPRDMADDWQPYTYGRWIHTDHGWTWVSSFPWGWAAFHYGSWAYLEGSGWIWVPSGVWSPARVVWRYSGSHVGWAPIIAGYDYGYGWADYPIFYAHWTFISWGFFCHHHPYHHFLHRRWVRRMFHRSCYPRRCRKRAGPACHHGPSRAAVTKKIGYPVPTGKVRQVSSQAREWGRAHGSKDGPGNGPKVSGPITLVSATRLGSRPKPAGIKPPRTRPIKPISQGTPKVSPKSPPVKRTYAPVPRTRRPDRRVSRPVIRQPRRPPTQRASRKPEITRPVRTPQTRRPAKRPPQTRRPTIRPPQTRRSTIRKPVTSHRARASSRPRVRTSPKAARPSRSRPPIRTKSVKTRSPSIKKKSSDSKAKKRSRRSIRIR